MKVESKQSNGGVAAPSIKAEVPAAETDGAEKRKEEKKKKRDKDKNRQINLKEPSSTGKGAQPSVKLEMKEEGGSGGQSAGKAEPGVKVKLEKDALGKAPGRKKLEAALHTALPNGRAQHQAGHASAQGKVKKTKDKLKG